LAKKRSVLPTPDARRPWTFCIVPRPPTPKWWAQRDGYVHNGRWISGPFEPYEQLFSQRSSLLKSPTAISASGPPHGTNDDAETAEAAEHIPAEAPEAIVLADKEVRQRSQVVGPDAQDPAVAVLPLGLDHGKQMGEDQRL
jgi:hypothetical protein